MSKPEFYRSELLREIYASHEKVSKEKRQDYEKIWFNKQRTCIDNFVYKFKKRMKEPDILGKAEKEAERGLDYYIIYKKGEFEDDQCIFSAMCYPDHCSYASEAILNVCKENGYKCSIRDGSNTYVNGIYIYW